MEVRARRRRHDADAGGDRRAGARPRRRRGAASGGHGDGARADRHDGPEARRTEAAPIDAGQPRSPRSPIGCRSRTGSAQLFLFGFQGQDLTAPIFERLRGEALGGIVIDAQQLHLRRPARVAGRRGRRDRRAGGQPQALGARSAGGRRVQRLPRPAAGHGGRRPRLCRATRRPRRGEAAQTLGGAGLSGVLGPVDRRRTVDGLAVGTRAFSSDPRDVADYARAVVGAYRAQSLLTAPGHFPGLGSGTEDTRLGPSRVGIEPRRAERLATWCRSAPRSAPARPRSR